MGKLEKRKQAAEAEQRRGVSRYWPYIFVALVILFFGLIRVRLLDLPLERDEGEYAYAGQLILQGVPPYELAYNMKLPGTYAAYALVLRVFGQTPAGVHAGLLLVNAATTLLVYFLAARLFGALAGVVSAASYALLSTSPTVLGFAAHATHFVALPAVAGALLLLKGIETKRTWLYFWSGVLAGLAFLMKQPGIFFVAFAGLYFLNSEWRRPVDWRGLCTRGAALLGGAALPFALTCLILFRAGVFSKFWFWTFIYARTYGSTLGPIQGSQVLWLMAPRVIAPQALIWAIAGAGLTAFLWNREARAHMIFITGFLLFSFLAVCPGFYFRAHYFIVMLPAVALLVGAAVSLGTRSLQLLPGARPWRFVPLLVFAMAFAYPLFAQQDFLFDMDPLMACRSLYGANPFPEALKIAAYLKSNTAGEARIAVLGSEPEIYFYAHRRSATGYIYVYPLMEDQKFASAMQKEMIAEIERARPEFIVYVNVPYSWVQRPESDIEIFTWSEKYLREQFELAGVADILDQTQYVWGEAAKTYRPLSQYTVQVFRRKAQ